MVSDIVFHIETGRVQKSKLRDVCDIRRGEDRGFEFSVADTSCAAIQDARHGTCDGEIRHFWWRCSWRSTGGGGGRGRGWWIWGWAQRHRFGDDTGWGVEKQGREGPQDSRWGYCKCHNGAHNLSALRPLALSFALFCFDLMMSSFQLLIFLLPCGWLKSYYEKPSFVTLFCLVLHRILQNYLDTQFHGLMMLLIDLLHS